MIEPSFLLIPWKRPVEEKWHSYETQNIFGAEMTDGYFTEITFSSEQQARDAINDRKKEIKKNRKEFFETPEKTHPIRINVNSVPYDVTVGADETLFDLLIGVLFPRVHSNQKMKMVSHQDL